MDNHTIFIADLHLSNNTPGAKKIFDRLIDNITDKTNALYLLGDLFQFWVGDDDCTIFNEEVKNTLKKISEKIPVYLMTGNRDFLLGETFARESGCTLITDPHLINLYGKKTLLTHGDLLCTKNIKYRIFRTLIRFNLGLKMFLKLPLSLRTWIAKNIQQYSYQSKQRKSKETLAPQPDAAKKLLTRFDSKQIIHGHIHFEEIEEFIFNGEKTFRISLGEWNEQKSSILIYRDDHSFEFNAKRV